MSLNRFAKRRDENEPFLIGEARKIGWFLTQLSTPVDWIGFHSGKWHVIEIKMPKGDYTEAQKRFLSDCKYHGAPVLTWRTVDDILDSTEVQLIGAHER